MSLKSENKTSVPTITTRMNTGGPLNHLNSIYGLSAPWRTVPVIKLIRQHHPSSRQTLVQLIASHAQEPPVCDCGIRSTGTIQDFGNTLYEAQIKEWREYRFTRDQCIQWHYQLFIVNSLRGSAVETKALNLFREYGWDTEESSDHWDCTYRVDLVLRHPDDKRIVCGIQVKPESFQRMGPSIQKFNKQCNRKWGYPVYYLYYDNKQQFSNLDEVLTFCKKTSPQIPHEL